MTGDKILVKFSPKRIMFQIGYDEDELKVRAELFRRVGHEVISVADNEAAKNALTSIHNVDVFVVGHTAPERSEEHTSELQSHSDLVCRLLLEKKKKKIKINKY